MNNLGLWFRLVYLLFTGRASPPHSLDSLRGQSRRVRFFRAGLLLASGRGFGIENRGFSFNRIQVRWKKISQLKAETIRTSTVPGEAYKAKALAIRKPSMQKIAPLRTQPK